MNRQPPVKTVPSPILRVRAVIMLTTEGRKHSEGIGRRFLRTFGTHEISISQLIHKCAETNQIE